MLIKPMTKFSHSDETKSLLTKNISSFDDQRQSLTDRRHAAVALTIYDVDGEASIIVTRRSPRLKEHSGQWALPGGRVDEGETAIEAALRELDEEVNLSLSSENVMGTLDDYITRSGYVITPVVVWSDTKATLLSPNPDEVASIHPFGFDELIRKDSPNLESIPQSDQQVLSMNYLDDVIYAPTAAMLYQFREVAILGADTRVLHFDQPLFAWK